MTPSLQNKKAFSGYLLYATSLVVFLVLLGASVLPSNAQNNPIQTLPGASQTVTSRNTSGSLVVGGTSTVNEGQTATATLQLNPAPTGSVIVSVSSANAESLTVSPTTLTFGSGDANPKNITLTGVQDANDIGETVTLTMQVTSTEDAAYTDATETVTVTVIDDEATPGQTKNIILTPEKSTFGEEEETRIGVRLSSSPDSDVVVNFSANDPRVQVTPTTLNFSPGSDSETDKFVGLSAVNDSEFTPGPNESELDLIDYSFTAKVDTAQSAADYQNTPAQTIELSVREDDSPIKITSTPAPSASEVIELEEGENGQFAVTPNFNPAETTFTPEVGVSTPISPSVLTLTPTTFTLNQSNGYEASVTMSTQEDEDFDDHTALIDFRIVDPGINAVSNRFRMTTKAVFVSDNDAPAILVTPSTTDLAENGGSAEISVTLDTEPTETVSLTPSADAGKLTFPENASMSFDSTNWNVAQSITVTAVDNNSIEDMNVTLTLTAGTSNTENPYNNVSADTEFNLIDDDFAQATSVTNPVTGTSNTIAVTGSECLVVTNYSVASEANTGSQDEGFDYPVGIHDYTLECDGNGDATQATIYLDKVYDTSTLVARKYNPTTQTYLTASGVTFGSAMVSGTEVTTMQVSLVDGGLNDQDGEVNGVIVDPIGPAQTVTPADTTTEADGTETGDTEEDDTANEDTTDNETETATKNEAVAGQTGLTRTGGFDDSTSKTPYYLGMVVSGAILLYGTVKSKLTELLQKL